MRKLTVSIAMPVTIEIEVKEDARDEELLVKILEQASKIDPSDYDSFLIQEVLDSKENNANIIYRILDIQDQLEREELEELEEKKNNEYYYDSLN